ncbi:hypothetical protein ACRZTK_004404 [Enterobacter asburiae]
MEHSYYTIREAAYVIRLNGTTSLLLTDAVGQMEADLNRLQKASNIDDQAVQHPQCQTRPRKPFPE